MLQLAYNEKGENKKRYIEPKSLLGKKFGVHLKDGGSFYFKCTGHAEGLAVFGYLTGFDDEMNDLKIDIDDIDLITGV